MASFSFPGVIFKHSSHCVQQMRCSKYNYRRSISTYLAKTITRAQAGGYAVICYLSQIDQRIFRWLNNGLGKSPDSPIGTQGERLDLVGICVLVQATMQEARQRRRWDLPFAIVPSRHCITTQTRRRVRSGVWRLPERSKFMLRHKKADLADVEEVWGLVAKAGWRRRSARKRCLLLAYHIRIRTHQSQNSICHGKSYFRFRPGAER